MFITLLPTQVLGVFLHAVGGFAAGSFYTPFRKVTRWAWESYWLVMGVAAWLIMPWVIAGLTAPNLLTILHRAPWSSMIWAYIFGALWGVGGLTFGLTMRYLGMSLGMAVALGFCATFGTLVPPIYEGNFLGLFSTLSGRVLLLGIVVCLTGIGVCGYAGIRKERELTDEQKKSAIKEFSLVKGLVVAVFSGVMSACMNFGVEAGREIANVAAAPDMNTPDVFKNNPTFILIMAGGFTTNFIWCLILNIRNRSGADYITGTPGLLAINYLFSMLAGAIWFMQFFFFGMGKTKMGKYDFSSWTIHMAFIIVFSSLWGLYFHEWRGVRRQTKLAVWTGIAVLILSTVVIGVGNYLAKK